MSQGEQTPDSSERRMRHIPFTPRSEASIRALCNWMQIAAIISIVVAVANFAGAFWPRQDMGKIIEGVIKLLIGLWIFQAGTAFRKVANTDSADQNHLMEGFRLLRRVFLLQAILIMLAFALLLVGIVLLLLFSLGTAATKMG